MQSDQKRRFIAEFLEQVRPASVWDLGANTGSFSRLASDRGIPTAAFDFDPACVEVNYREVKKRQETRSASPAGGPAQSRVRPAAGSIGSERPSCRGAGPRWSWPWPWFIIWRSPGTCPWRTSLSSLATWLRGWRSNSLPLTTHRSSDSWPSGAVFIIPMTRPGSRHASIAFSPFKKSGRSCPGGRGSCT